MIATSAALRKLNTSQNRQIALNLAKNLGRATLSSIQTRRRRRGKRVLFPQASRIPSGLRTMTTQRTAASLTTQTTQPGPLRVSDSEVCVIPVSKEENSDPTGFALTPSEGFLWPKLTPKIGTYTYYRALGPIQITWVPRVGTAVSGTIVMGFSSNVGDSLNGFNSVSALSNTVSTPISQSATLVIPISSTNQAIYNRLSLHGADSVQQVTDAPAYLGMFYYAIEGNSGAMTPGYFRATYSFELTTPKLDATPMGSKIILDGGVWSLESRRNRLTIRKISATAFEIYAAHPVRLVQEGLIATLDTWSIDGVGPVGGWEPGYEYNFRRMRLYTMAPGFHTLTVPATGTAGDHLWLF